jgi:hypothetical protein
MRDFGFAQISREESEGDFTRFLLQSRLKRPSNPRVTLRGQRRYAAKHERFPEGIETGRAWGKWNEELLTVGW